MSANINTAKAILASPELESEWKLSGTQIRKIHYIWGGLKQAGLFKPFENISGLYRGFIVRTGKMLFHVYGTNVFRIHKGIVEKRLDRDKKFEITVLNTAPENLLPKFIYMKVNAFSEACYENSDTVYKQKSNRFRKKAKKEIFA